MLRAVTHARLSARIMEAEMIFLAAWLSSPVIYLVAIPPTLFVLAGIAALFGKHI